MVSFYNFSVYCTFPIPRLPLKVVALKVDLEAKSQAATAGWNAAAGAESEVAAAEARGLQDGINRGKAAADQEARGFV